MIQPINHDQLFLKQASVPATPADQQVITDLVDTLHAHQENCVGMAANMIGVRKRIIVCQLGPLPLVLVNPTIVVKSGRYTTAEGCLSLPGERTTERYRQLTVQYLNRQFQKQQDQFDGLIAQIIQHEIDHCNGVLI